MKIIIPTDKAYLEISLVEPVASLAGVPQLEPEDSFNQSIPSTKLPYQKLDYPTYRYLCIPDRFS